MNRSTYIVWYRYHMVQFRHVKIQNSLHVLYSQNAESISLCV